MVKRALTLNLAEHGNPSPVTSDEDRRFFMSPEQFLATFIVLVLGAAFLFIWMRRDRGIVPDDQLPEVLHEPLDGRPASKP